MYITYLAYFKIKKRLGLRTRSSCIPPHLKSRGLGDVFCVRNSICLRCECEGFVQKETFGLPCGCFSVCEKPPGRGLGVI